MTIATKATIKTHFTTGSFPTQQNFIDFIDSFLGLGETGSQTIPGPVTVSGAASFISGVTVSGASILHNAVTVSGATGLYGDIVLGVSAKSTLQAALGLNKLIPYQVTDATDIALNTTPTQSNFGASRSISIPTKGIIELAFFGQLLSAVGANYLILGIRIGSTNYWATSTAEATTEYHLAATGIGVGTETASSLGSQTQPGAFYNERVGLSIEGLSIPTGTQTVQVIASKYSTTAYTIKGTIITSIVNILVSDYS